MPELRRLRERGVNVQPIEIAGQTIARGFWGRRWCEQLGSCADHEDRLPRGRVLLRNGSVCHLEIRAGTVEAMVAGSALFHVVVRIPTIEPAAWRAVGEACAGRIGSVPDLLHGRLTDPVIETVTDPGHGLLPRHEEIERVCDCNEKGGLCRHAAAALYGVGNRLDAAPELLFRLRGVDEAELIASAAPSSAPPASDRTNHAPAEAPPAAPTEAPPTEPGPDANGDGAAFQPSGALIRQLRHTSGFSVAEFAELLQVSAATVRRWEAVAGLLTLRARPREALRTLHDAITEVAPSRQP